MVQYLKKAHKMAKEKKEKKPRLKEIIPGF